MPETPVCPACGAAFGGQAALAAHLVDLAGKSDGMHVMWLNRNVSKHRMSASELEQTLTLMASGDQPAGERLKR